MINDATFEIDGVKYSCDITLGTANYIGKSDYSLLTDQQISLIGIMDKDCLMELWTNYNLNAAVVYTILVHTKQYEGTQEEFCDKLTGPVMESMRKALWGGLGNFIPNLQDALSTIQRFSQRMEEQITQEMKEQEEAILEMGIKAIRKETEKALKKGGEVFGGKLES